MLKPVYTEKSLSLAKQGKYSFWVNLVSTKTEIKDQINKLFGVHVKTIKTVVGHTEAKRNMRGMKFLKKSNKKAIVTLREKEKIEIFEEAKK